MSCHSCLHSVLISKAIPRSFSPARELCSSSFDVVSGHLMQLTANRRTGKRVAHLFALDLATSASIWSLRRNLESRKEDQVGKLPSIGKLPINAGSLTNLPPLLFLLDFFSATTIGKEVSYTRAHPCPRVPHAAAQKRLGLLRILLTWPSYAESKIQDRSTSTTCWLFMAGFNLCNAPSTSPKPQVESRPRKQ